MDHRKFVIRPFAGLGNRLWALDSCASLCKDIGVKKFTLVWEKGPEINCRFADLFQRTDFIEVIETIPFCKFRFESYRNIYNILPPHDYRYPLFNALFGRERRVQMKLYDGDMEEAIINNFDFRQLAGYESVYISTNRRFYQPAVFNTYLGPVAGLQEQIDEVVSGFAPHTVGVHLRRGDHVYALEGSPIEAFIRVMESEIAVDAGTVFFLSTDSGAEKRMLIERFGARIITRKSNLDRNSTEGAQDALIDMFCLSKCNKVIGSIWSSFSDVAARIGNIPLLIPVSKRFKWENYQNEGRFFKTLWFDYRIVDV